MPGFSYEIIQTCCDLIHFFVLEIRTEPDCKLRSTLFRHPAFYVEFGVTEKKLLSLTLCIVVFNPNLPLRSKFFALLFCKPVT